MDDTNNVLALQQLPMEGMDSSEESADEGGGGGSRASLLLCGDSSLSVVTCD